jgi:hypothetical protein
MLEINKKHKLAKLTLLLIILEGFGVLLALILIPSDPKHSFLFGRSGTRWGMILLIALMIVLFFIIFIKKIYHIENYKSFTVWAIDALQISKIYAFLLIIFIILIGIFFLSLEQLQNRDSFLPQAVLVRLLPLIIWAGLISLKGVCWLCALPRKNNKNFFVPRQRMAGYYLLFLVTLVLPFIKTDPLAPYRYASNILTGQKEHLDIAADIYGFRALVQDEDPYAVLGPALRTIGVEWDLDFPSTHPPMTFLLVAPIAFFPYPLASSIWGWLMIVALMLSFRMFGCSWIEALILTIISLFWRPTVTSLGNLTIAWLLGLMGAYHFRDTNYFLAGVFIGIASFTKLFPVFLLVPFIIRRRWQAIFGFVASLIVAVATLLILSPSVFLDYAEVSSSGAGKFLYAPENASFLVFLHNHLGTSGFIIGALSILALILITKFWKYEKEKISLSEWNLFSFLAIILLPIAWIYSILPLIIVIWSLIRQNGIGRYLALTALIIPQFSSNWGEDATSYIFSFYILLSLSIIFERRRNLDELSQRQSVTVP